MTDTANTLHSYDAGMYVMYISWCKKLHAGNKMCSKLAEQFKTLVLMYAVTILPTESW